MHISPVGVASIDLTHMREPVFVSPRMIIRGSYDPETHYIPTLKDYMCSLNGPQMPHIYITSNKNKSLTPIPHPPTMASLAFVEYVESISRLSNNNVGQQIKCMGYANQSKSKECE